MNGASICCYRHIIPVTCDLFNIRTLIIRYGIVRRIPRVFSVRACRLERSYENYKVNAWKPALGKKYFNESCVLFTGRSKGDQEDKDPGRRRFSSPAT